MKRHDVYATMLTAYLLNELDEGERTLFEEHLAGCRECAKELHRLRTAINELTDRLNEPAGKLPGAYWSAFTERVEERLLRVHARRPSIIERLGGLVEILFARPAYALSVAGSVCAVIIVMMVLWKRGADVTPPEAGFSSASRENAVPITPVNMRLQQYFRKSRVLLVGISNLREEDQHPVDLSVEQNASRELVREARFLKSRTLDPRSAELIQDLEKILIELANMETESDMPNVEIIRGGIRDENLLFKIRMAEALYDTAHYVPSHRTY